MFIMIVDVRQIEMVPVILWLKCYCKAEKLQISRKLANSGRIDSSRR
jgi:hypothetical protein